MDVRAWQGQDCVWPTKLPLVRKTWTRGKIGRIALDGALTHPPLNRLDLISGQASFADESWPTRLRQPWRHFPAPGRAGDLLRAGLCILIRQQRKWNRFFTGSVTRCAAFEDDGRDILVERRVKHSVVRMRSRAPARGRARGEKKNGGATQRAASVAAALIGCGLSVASVRPSDHFNASKYICWTSRMSHVLLACANEP